MNAYLPRFNDKRDNQGLQIRLCNEFIKDAVIFLHESLKTPCKLQPFNIKSTTNFVAIIVL